MSTSPTYAPGTPMWVDVTSPDLPNCVRFYTQLFGWEAEDLGEQAGHYTMFRKNGKMVAAASGPMDPSAPPVWSTYIHTADAAATAAKVREAGGQVVMEPFDVMDSGRMGVFTDPTGAFICVWEPKQHQGAELANEPGSFCWNELATRDIEAAKRFYPAVFGWSVDPQGPDYTMWTVDGRGVAGGMPMGDNFPAEVPPHWLVYFAVDDVDAAIQRAQELGGRSSPIMESPYGRFSVINDPSGAVFAAIKLTNPS